MGYNKSKFNKKHIIYILNKIFEGDHYAQFDREDLFDTPEIIDTKGRRDTKAIAYQLSMTLVNNNAANLAGQFQTCIQKLATLYRYWVRDSENWKPSTRNLDRQFHHLARYMLAKYPVPRFFNDVFENSRYDPYWFVMVAQGENLRKATNLPVIFLCKMT
ncbi:MAG: hypothetical protein AAF570_12740, partial [Bacteroidota bacterium]